jgi:hypothetical protein
LFIVLQDLLIQFEFLDALELYPVAFMLDHETHLGTGVTALDTNVAVNAAGSGSGTDPLKVRTGLV